ncbi:MAG: hypothetical protein K8R90_09915 [Candidatus Cloacimonetes bacterium]|nr:hypothetical protein [Candidatus Cloacimonadota bacterium]
MRRTTMFVLMLTVVCALAAQSFDPYINPHWRMPSLLNPNKLQINHSASFSAGASSTGEGFYQSMYTNHLHYRFNPRLDLRVNLNFVNFGSATMHGGFDIEGNNDNATHMIPEVMLLWRPTDSTSLRIEFSRMPARNPSAFRYWPEP